MTDDAYKISSAYMRLARKLGRGCAERAVAAQPLPWSEEDVAVMIAILHRSVVEALPGSRQQDLHSAVSFHAANFMIERSNELSAAAGVQPEGGAA